MSFPSLGACHGVDGCAALEVEARLILVKVWTHMLPAPCLLACSVPGEDLVGFGQLVASSDGRRMCLQADAASQAHRGVSFKPCLGADTDIQEFALRKKDGTLKLMDGHGTDLCLTAKESNSLRLQACSSPNARWQLTSQSELQHSQTHLCLTDQQGHAALQACSNGQGQHLQFTK
eukprot:TRINITY_DN11929_c0_g1_i3.p3 TRINITY_DN11929_c0_g1~~TRINITY_DN11929_c0_g1_i3.p3  ORF type:complete len:176 (+),score=39.91 TRINITY_DN11929_c0_g1_i3:1750-2277(+)